MTRLLTCKRFLQELNDYLDEKPGSRGPQPNYSGIVNECPNCWVVCDTTEKTLKIFKGMQAQLIPAAVQARLSEYLAKHCRGKKSDKACEEQSETQIPPVTR